MRRFFYFLSMFLLRLIGGHTFEDGIKDRQTLRKRMKKLSGKEDLP